MEVQRAHQRNALSYISRQLSSDDDVALTASLLNIASRAGADDRTVTAEQYDLLSLHRVTSLIPTTWTVEGRDAARDRAALIAQTMVLDNSAQLVSRCLAVEKIEHRVLKGLATGSLDYENDTLRTYGDIDFLVDDADFDRAVVALSSQRVALVKGVQRRREFVKGLTLETPEGVEVDLHYRITHTAPPPAGLFDAPALIEGMPFCALPPALRLLHAAVHLLLSPPGTRRLSGLADISAIRCSNLIDLEEVRHHAQLMRCEPAVGYALTIERVIRGLEADTAHWSRPSRLERWAYFRTDPNTPGEYLYQLTTLQGLSERLRFISHFVAPTVGASIRRRGIVHVVRRTPTQGLGGRPPDVEI